MSEHARENGYQWCDTEVYMVWDFFYDCPDRGSEGIVFKNKDDAIAYAIRKGWESRTVILKLPAILAYKLTPTASGEPK